MEDLRNWSKGLARCTEALRSYAKKIQTYDNAFDQARSQFDDAQDVEITVKLLRFLCLLMKAGRDKRYFLFFEVITPLLNCILQLLNLHSLASVARN